MSPAEPQYASARHLDHAGRATLEGVALDADVGGIESEDRGRPFPSRGEAKRLYVLP